MTSSPCERFPARLMYARAKVLQDGLTTLPPSCSSTPALLQNCFY